MSRWSFFSGAIALLATAASAQQIDTARVHEDALVLRRVLQVSKKEIPRDILKSIANESLEAIRGPRNDATYLWARHERDDAGKFSEGFTIEAKNKPTFIRHRGEWVYRLTVHAPSRRYLVRRNQRVLIERIDFDITPIGTTPARVETVEVNEWIDPGGKRDFELSEIARVARVTVTARTQEKAGPAGLELTFTRAKLVDDPRSPYSRTAENLKLFLQRLEKGDRDNLQTLANLLVADPALGRTERSFDDSVRSEPILSEAEIGPGLSRSELYVELQTIQDLLTGSSEERIKGMDALHQLIRQVRPQRP
jgi:hypothetical protein